jgi:hypothetical protein
MKELTEGWMLTAVSAKATSKTPTGTSGASGNKDSFAALVPAAGRHVSSPSTTET